MGVESKTLEYKREYTEDIKKTVIAFGNSKGGTIYIGVEDDGSIRGLDDPDDVITRVTNSIRDSIRPDITLFTEAFTERREDKIIVRITVQRGTARPYYISGKGIRPEGVYVRHGASTVPATETAIQKMIIETGGHRYENARSLNQQLTFDQTAAYFARKGIVFEEIQKKSLHFIGEDGMYTNLALLLSDQCLHSIKLAVFEGDEKAIFKERREFAGSLLYQVDEAFLSIDRFNSTRAEFKGLDRIDQRDYPPEAIREALLNSVVHRDYAFNGSTLISLFDDRIEFVSIGGLVKGITLEDIMLGLSIPRNEHLAAIFYRLKLIEAYGTGIPKIMAAYGKYSVKPIIEATDNAFKITLPNTNSNRKPSIVEGLVGLSERENQVLALLRNNRLINRKDVEKALGISQSSAGVLLRGMAEKRLLRKDGSGKLTRYSRGE